MDTDVRFKYVGLVALFLLFGVVVLGIQSMRLTERVELLETTLQRADQSCAVLESRYNSDVAKYWNPLVDKFNYQTNETSKLINQHADLINDIETRLEEVEKRRFF